MNQFSPIRTQEFFTARELAEVAADRGLSGFPASERGARQHAERAGWNTLPETLVRFRTDRQGGRPSREYHFSLLPDCLRAALEARQMRDHTMSRHVAQAETDRRQVAAIRTAALSPGARATLEARAEILSAIEGFAIAHGNKRAWGIAQFMEAQTAWVARQEIEARREAGQILTAREAANLVAPLQLSAADGFQLDPATLQVANSRRKTALVKRSALYEWFKARDTQGVAALAPEPPKVAEPIPAEFAAFLKFYAVPMKPTAAEAHRQYLLANEGRSDLLSLTQVRYILKERLNNIEKNVGREGLLTLRSRMAYVTRTTEGMWPTTIYTADGKTFDAEVADPVSNRPMRPEITSVLDVATRKCVGWAASRKENVIAVTEALRRSCASHGICAIFYTDRGAGYKNKTFDADAGGLMGRLGITKMHALPYNSQAKGLIERFNHVWNDLARELPSYIGRDMDKEAKQRVHKASRTDIREFGQARLLPSWDDFTAMVEARIAAYNDRPHGGLPRFEDPATGRRRHMSPNEAWDAHVADGFEAVTLDPEEVDDLFRPYEVRTVRRALVEWNRNQYFHLSLEPYHDRKVMVGYDLDQAENVWVREFDEESGQPGALICVATYSGNKARYMPLTQQRAAEEQRVRGQLRRLGKKQEAALDQLNAPLLDMQPSVPLAPVMPAPEPVPAPVAGNSDAGPGRSINSDAELALICLGDPEELTEGRARLLRDVLSRRNGRELLRISGVDLDQLEDLLKSAA